MAAKTKKISTLIESQLPEFIVSEYGNFSKFLEKYYEHQESQGQSLDIISNITKYRDINFYEKEILNQYTTLASSITQNSDSIVVENATSFPRKNGYIKIGDEICFYGSRTDTEFLEVSRGVSGNTKLGDLYSESEFVSTNAKPHYQNDKVYNISNLFLYAFVKSFESQYLDPFPEKYLKEDIDKRTLIKNITDFYRSKGTEKSIQFVFNSLISKSSKDVPSTYNPKDFTIKASSSDWVTSYVLKVQVLSGDVMGIVGQVITQDFVDENDAVTSITAVVDNVVYSGANGVYDIVLSPSTVSDEFKIASKTKLKTTIGADFQNGDRVDVFSTFGWASKGKFLVNNEEIEYASKNVNQFIINKRSSLSLTHTAGSEIYSIDYITARSSNGLNVRLLPVGVLYDLVPNKKLPYSEVGDRVQINYDGIVSDHPAGQARWFYNTTFSKAFSSNNIADGQINDLNSDISAIFEDEQYFYVCSSSFPGHSVFNQSFNDFIYDQRLLKLIRKYPTLTTEIYPTTNRDVGIFVDGSPAFSYRDFDAVIKGKIETISVVNKGNNYKSTPYVLLNDIPFKAKAVMSGEVVSSVTVTSEDVYDKDPVVTITSGRNAEVTPIVTNGEITSIVITNPGEYYSSPPEIRIIDQLGKGNFVEVESVISADGRLVQCRIINGGRFYSRENLFVEIIPQGSGATATATVKRWVKNRYNNLNSQLDQNNGTKFLSFNPLIGNGYGVVANPANLRYRLSDGVNSAFAEIGSSNHSPIIGFAYDGNPIYGPYGYVDPYDPESSVGRIGTGYTLKSSRSNGPSIADYPLGSFIDDYEWTPSVNSGKTELDINNGRFCVTPEYPEGTYAYFVTIDSLGNPEFPYIVGENYYSLPVDSNYNSGIIQDDLPTNVKRLKTSDFETNGVSSVAVVDDVLKGSVSGATSEYSEANFAVGSDVYAENLKTGGSGAKANVSEIEGLDVFSLESDQTKAIKLELTNSAYLFDGDVFFQGSGENTVTKIYVTDETITESGPAPASNIKVVSNLTIDKLVNFQVPRLDITTLTQGEVVGDVRNGNTVVLRNCTGEFVQNGLGFSSTDVSSLFLDNSASYSANAVLTLRDEDRRVIAQGIVLESTIRQNSVRVRVTAGQFFASSNYTLKSSVIEDTTNSEIISVSSLSSELRINNVNDNIGLVRTIGNHNLGIGDFVDVNIFPDDTTTESTYYVRKKLFQKVTLKEVEHNSVITDSGIGRFDVYNFGIDYRTGTYEDIELIFVDSTKSRFKIGRPGDPNNARATIVVNDLGGNYGRVISITLTNKGSGYKKTDLLTVSDSDLNRLGISTSTFRLNLFVDHVGFASQESILNVDNVNNVSSGDFLRIGEEIIKVTSVNTDDKYIVAERGQRGTRSIDHFDGKSVTGEELFFTFASYYRPVGDTSSSPYFNSFDPETREFVVSYNYAVGDPIRLQQSSIFFDLSSPSKLIQLENVNAPEAFLEFSKDGENFEINPTIDIQKYYKYKFDTSHPSMSGTFIDFSPSTNYNLLSEEKLTSGIAPGLDGSFTTLKLGFGPLISTNNQDTATDLRFTNYYYFIQASSEVNTQQSFLRVINDPLSGKKRVNYVTPNRFSYDLTAKPQYDGTGSITYTTTSQFAVGKISKIFVTDSGSDYSKLPIVSGVLPAPSKQSIVEVDYDEDFNVIRAIKVLDQGSDYLNPVALVVDGDGKRYNFECIHENGKVKKVNILNPGVGFTYKPTIRIYESNVKVYFRSDSIGVPQTIKILSNGSLYTNDASTIPQFKSVYSLLIKDFGDGNFYDGERVNQIESGQVTATGKVAKNGWRLGSNLLRLQDVQGNFKVGSQIKGLVNSTNATVVTSFNSEFLPTIKSYFDNIGYYTSDKGKLGVNSQKITDSYFYQDYAYVIKSKTPIDFWRDLIYQTTHPAGFQLFGELMIEGEAKTPMPTNQSASDQYSIIGVQVKLIESHATVTQVTNKTISTQTLQFSRGLGTVSVDPFDGAETEARVITLSAPFDADFNEVTGQVFGTKTFTLINERTGNAYHVGNEQELIVTIDGIFQEPGKSYTVDGNKITFAQAPLGERIAEGQVVPAQKFRCRAIKFKSSLLNAQYLYKIRNISTQFDSVTKEFELYKEDGSIVKTDERENLVVVLDGILQNARHKEKEPIKNSYYIRRSSDPAVTDKIVFSEAPINHEDLYEDIDEQIDAFSKCFIYSIGNYYRLTIDTRTVKYRQNGPYLLLDERDYGVVKVEDTNYALVFLNGVLQEPIDSYSIVGPSITFTKPLPYFQDDTGDEILPNVSIILFYGRDTQKSCKFFDFESQTFFVRATLTLSGDSFDSSGFYGWYGDLIQNTGGESITVYQGDDILGIFTNVSAITDEFKVSLTSKSYYDLNDDPIRFKSLTSEYTINGTYDKQIGFTTDESGQLILTRDVVPWLDGTELANEANAVLRQITANLLEGDRVLIDGETEFREILEVPSEVYPTNYNKFRDTTNDFYATVKTSNYDGITRGEGLAVTSKLDENGTITELVWNKRDLELYFNTGTLLPSTAYGYETSPQLEFIPKTEKGGGARARVVTYGGQVIDVELIDGGIGYEEPPTIVVARSYTRIKVNRETTTRVDYIISPKIEVFRDYNTISSITVFGSEEEGVGINNVIVLDSIRNTGNQVTIIFPVPWDDIRDASMPEDGPKDNRPEYTVQSPTIEIPMESVQTTEFGMVHIIDARAQDITSSVAIETIDKQLTSIIELDVNESIIPEAYETLNEVGAFLDAPVSPTDTIIYIPDTSRFPDSSRLLINKEIVTYLRKESNRFLNVERGVRGTTVNSHNAGDFVLHLPEILTVVSGGATSVETEFVSEHIVRSAYVNTKLLAQIQLSESVAINAEVISKEVRSTDLEIFIDTSTEKGESRPLVSTYFVSLVDKSDEDSISSISTISTLSTYDSIVIQTGINLVESVLCNDDIVTVQETVLDLLRISAVQNFVTNIEVNVESAERSITLIDSTTVSTISTIVEEPVTAYTSISSVRMSEDRSITKQVTFNLEETSDIQSVETSILVNVELAERTITLIDSTTVSTISTIVEEPVTTYISLSTVSMPADREQRMFELRRYYEAGVVDYPHDAPPAAEYHRGTAGFNTSSLNTMGFLDYGGADVGNEMTIEQFDLYYGHILLGDVTEQSATTISGDDYNIALGSINDLGSHTVLGDGPGATWIDVYNAENWPSSGKLVILGKEIEYYSIANAPGDGSIQRIYLNNALTFNYNPTTYIRTI